MAAYKNLLKERNLDDLRASTADACAAYVSDRTPASAFGHAVRHYATLQAAGARAGRTALSSAFGGALLDRAVTDATCVACDVSFDTALRANALGIDASLAPDLAAFAIDAFLDARSLPDSIAVRHTVGLADPLDAPDVRPDRLPVSLVETIERYGHRYFKLKLGGDVDADIARLAAIARILDRLPSYSVTLDGNEQYPDFDAVARLLARLQEVAELRRLAAAVLYFEQPLARHEQRAVPPALRESVAFLLDEGDDDYDAWPRGRAAGYTGVSSKSCKGLYKSVVNAMRCAMWNEAVEDARYFMSGEDLTTPCGLALQQDVALAAALGIGHVERNGHHYVNGFDGQAAPSRERAAFVAAHGDLYERNGGNANLAIRDGSLSLRSLRCAGFATTARPDAGSMSPLRPVAKVTATRIAV